MKNKSPIYGGWYDANNPAWAPELFKPGHFEVELVRFYFNGETSSAKVVQEGEQLLPGHCYVWTAYLREAHKYAQAIGDFKTYGEAHRYGEQIANQIANP